MHLLCTLRGCCRQQSRNTRYQAGAAPYLDRTSTGWIAPACLAHSLDDLIGNSEKPRRHIQAERTKMPRLARPGAQWRQATKGGMTALSFAALWKGECV